MRTVTLWQDKVGQVENSQALKNGGLGLGHSSSKNGNKRLALDFFEFQVTLTFEILIFGLGYLSKF